MGKGNRNRQERAEDKALNPEKYVKKKKSNWASAIVGPLLAALILVLVVVVLIGNSLTNGGVIMRSRTAAESDDFEVNGAMMTYYVYSSYSNYVNYLYEVYSSMMSSSSNIDVYKYMGIDPNVSLKDQIYDEESGQTWFDYFADMAKTQVEQQLVYAQAAKEAGVKLDDDDYAAIDQNIEMIGAYAELYGVSFNSYLANNYGKGVREKDIRRALELTQLSAKYAETVKDGFFDATTEESVTAFYNENKNDYLYADYVSYKLTAEKNDDAENADEVYAADKEAIRTAADKLLACKTEEEFREYLKSYVATLAKETYTDQYYDQYVSESTAETDEAKAEEANKRIEDKAAADAETVLEGILTEGVAYTTDTDLGAWIFGKDDAAAAKVGETFEVVDESKDADGDYAITVYMLVAEPARKDATTRNFTYLLLEEGSYTEADAKAALTLFETNGDITSEGLIKLGEDYDKKSACTTLEEAALGSTGVDELDAWLFTDDRKAGDYTQITYTYEDKEFYIVVYVDEIGPAEWYIACRDALVSEQVTEWYDEASKTHVVTINDAVVAKVNM